MNFPIKVLYVDDDAVWREIIGGIISKLNYHVEYASSYAEAIEILKRTFFHIALLDKKLDENDPENEDGLRIARFIVNLKEGTKVMIFTAHGDIQDVRTALLDIGVSDFLEKDTPTNEIKKSLQQLVDKVLIDLELPSRRSEVVLTVKGTAVNQFISSLTSEPDLATDMQRFELFSRRLLSEYRPLLPDRKDAQLIKIGSTQVLQARFWSKMLGFPMAALLGKFDEMGLVLKDINADENLRFSLGIKNKIDELFDSSNFPRFGGALFELSDVKFEEFESKSDFYTYP